MASVQEQYTALPIGVNTAVNLPNDTIAGFIAKTSGTITIVDGNGTTIVDAFPVTAGVDHPFPFFLQKKGGTVTTAGGAGGTLAL
jgi:hypothetical protein